MELDDYRAVAALVETQSVRLAAEKLHRVPSAVSMRIKALEEELGCALFVRAGRGVRAMPAALKLAQAAAQILPLSDSAVASVVGKKIAGVLRIGALDSIIATHLTPVLSRLIKAYPEIELQLEVGVSEQLCEAVAQGRLDCALFIDAPDDRMFERKKVFSERLLLAACSGHKPVTSPRDCENDALVAFSRGCSYRERMLEWYAMYGCRPGRIVEVNSYSALIGCVAAGMGIAAVPQTLINLVGRHGISAHKLPKELRRAEIECVRLKANVSPNVLAFKSVLENADKRREPIAGLESV